MAKGLAHLIVADYLKLSAELNRPVPQDYYFQNGMYSKRNVDSTFGGWLQLVQAAGYHIPTVKKLDKEEIRKKSYEHLKKEIDKKKIFAPPPIGRNIICLGDLHAPWMHHNTIDFVSAVVKKYGYDLALATGDESDGASISFHGSDPELPSPGFEFELAVKQLKPLYNLFPKLLLASSNHGDLLARKMKHHGLPIRALKSMNEILECPEGWRWEFEHIVQTNDGKKILLHHAYSSDVLRASQQRGISCIFGHHHSKFSIQYWQNYDDLFYAIFAGCLVDPLSLAMAYAKNSMHRPVLGLVRIENGTPHLIPMKLDRGNNWTGKF